MCFRPTKEETVRTEVRRSVERPEPEERREPWSYPEPRGNGEADAGEVERSEERLEGVLGH